MGNTQSREKITDQEESTHLNYQNLSFYFKGRMAYNCCTESMLILW